MPDEPRQRNLTHAARKAMVARGHKLEPSIVVGRQGLTDMLVAQIRRAFERTDLLKVKVGVERGHDADSIGTEIAIRVPCVVVRRVGKTLLLSRLAEADATGGGDGTA